VMQITMVAQELEGELDKDKLPVLVDHPTEAEQVGEDSDQMEDTKVTEDKEVTMATMMTTAIGFQTEEEEADQADKGKVTEVTMMTTETGFKEILTMVLMEIKMVQEDVEEKVTMEMTMEVREVQDQ
jgi:hypothetical protein